MKKSSDSLQHSHLHIIFILKISSFWFSSLWFLSLSLSLRSKHRCSSLVSISVLSSVDWGLWTLNPFSPFSSVSNNPVLCCGSLFSAVTVSLPGANRPWGIRLTSTILSRALTAAIPSVCYFQHVCLEIKGYSFAQNLDSGDLLAVFECINVPTKEIWNCGRVMSKVVRLLILLNSVALCSICGIQR